MTKRVVMCVKTEIGMVDHYVEQLKNGKQKILGPVHEVDATDAAKAKVISSKKASKEE